MSEGDRPFRIGVLTPMPSEQQPVVRAMSLQRVGDDRFYRGTVAGAEIVLARTGMGTKLAREATARLLDSVDVDHIMIVGIAGGMGPSKVGDVLFPERVVNKHTGGEYKPSPLGGVAPRGKLMTHDDFDMGPTDLRRYVSEGFIAVDMETAAVAEVCEQRGRPWLAVRAISDLVGVTPGDVIDLAHPDGSPNIKAALRYMMTKPWRIPKLVRLARESTQAANAAAKAAARTVRAR
jgi:adenosylhomocysteine nucleosidase